MSIFGSPEGSDAAAAQLTRGEKIHAFLSQFAHANPTDNYLSLALHAHSGRHNHSPEAGGQSAEVAVERTVIIEEVDIVSPSAE